MNNNININDYTYSRMSRLIDTADRAVTVGRDNQLSVAQLGEYIILAAKNVGFYITDYTDNAWELFTSGVLGTFRTSGAKKNRYPAFGCSKEKVQLTWIVYCLHRRELNKDNWQQVIRDFRVNEMCKSGEEPKTIDHLHGGAYKYNYCIANLCVVSQSVNSEKSALDRIKRNPKKDLILAKIGHSETSIIEACDSEGNIRVEIAHIIHSFFNVVGILRYYFKDDDSHIKFLSELRDNGLDKINDSTDWHEQQWGFDTVEYCVNPIIRTIRPVNTLEAKQKEIVNMDLSMFQLIEYSETNE